MQLALQLARDEDVRVAVHRGVGGVFCSGADLKFIRDGGDARDLAYLTGRHAGTGEPAVGYGDVFKQAEIEYSAHNSEHADTEMLFRHFSDAEKECQALLAARLVDAVRWVDGQAALADLPATPGHEWRVRDALLAALPKWARDIAITDSAGNLIVAAGPDRDPLAIIAHMDEVGYEIERILPDGRVTATRGQAIQWGRARRRASSR